MLFSKAAVEVIVNKILDQREKEFEKKLDMKMKTEIMASEINFETAVQAEVKEKFNKISAIINEIKSSSKELIDNNKSLADEVRNRSHFDEFTDNIGTVLKKFSTNISKHNEKIDVFAQNTNDMREDVDSSSNRLESFIEVISDQISELSKKKKPIAKVFKDDKCPFDAKVGYCEIWVNREDANDAPKFCTSCRETVSLNNKGITNVSIRQIAAGNSRSTNAGRK